MKHSKGISTVIAVVLLLLVTVGIVMTFSTWIKGTMETATKGAGETVEKGLSTLGIEFTIKAGYDTDNDLIKLTVINTGDTDIELEKLKVFIKGLPQTITSGNSGTLSPGDSAILDVQNSTEACNEVISVMYSGIERSDVIEC